MDKAYIKKKIENCQGLVDDATSDAQAKIYQGYLDFWTKKLPKSQRPETIAKVEEKAAKERDDELAFQMAEAAAKYLAEEAEKEALVEKAAKDKRKAELKAELAALDDPIPEPEELNEINFELLYPNKKAYRTQNGERIETIAYKEYLTKTESE